MTAVDAPEFVEVRSPAWWRAGVWLVLTALSLAVLSFWSYRSFLQEFFHFDDFWVLAVAAQIHVHSFSDLGQFFQPVHGFLLYRPISTVFYFYALREAFGYNPVGYHATQIAFHVLNGILVYCIADRLLHASRALGTATALVYASAPGHAIAACWIALFTVTGTAFLYFCGLLIWVSLDSRWRVPLTLLFFVLALLASEHAVSFPLALTLMSALVLRPVRWQQMVREQWLFYVIGGCYTAAKLYYVRHMLGDLYPNLMARAFAEAGYRVSLAPSTILRNLGKYVGFTLNVAYSTTMPDERAFAIGVGVVALALLGSVCVLCGYWQARSLRVAVFGLDFFIVALGPVLVLPQHVYSYYVGIAGLGLALTLVGAASSGRRGRTVAPWIVVAILLIVHVRSAAESVRRSDEFRFYNSFARGAARWLNTLSVRTAHRAVDEVLIPQNSLTRIVFDVGQAHTLFLCAPYQVRTVAGIGDAETAPGRLIVSAPDPLPPDRYGSWDWLRRDCAR